MYSLSPTLANASSLSDVVEALDTLNTPVPNIIHSGLIDSYTISTLYLSSVYQNSNVSDINHLNINPTIHAQAIEAMRVFFSQCKEDSSSGTTNSCFTETQELQNIKFASGKADSLVGYFENLSSLKLIIPKEIEIFIQTLVVGNATKYPVLFTDIFVKNVNCNYACTRLADDFSKFITAPEILSYILMGKDASNSRPRYIIPAIRSVFNHPDVTADPYYKQIKLLICNATAFPNHGIPDLRKSWQQQILPIIMQSP